ncbi:N-acetylgalactosamine-6-sulfatase-like isoform X2 [Oscarella lobularis]|uniref:N-acetylgalactosamine-6-sulfatase-like isoform X2 n=1 Tax=Oscarella lobularis TaxID=121494 RepID=UPI003313C708
MTAATLLYVASIAFVAIAFTSPARKPNIVVIFADDFGFDVDCFGSPTTRTPNLNRMAAEGMKLTQYYSAHSICSPSRAALLTGRYALRSGIYGNLTKIPPGTGDHRVVHPNCYGGLPSSESTVAELLRQNGYATMMIGKWHLGYSYEKPDQLPTRHGFDVFYGTPYTHCEGPPNYPPVPVFSNETKIGRLGIDINTNDLVYDYNSEAMKFIASQGAAGRPFFLYMALDNTHSQVYYPTNFTGYTRRGPFGDATAALDWNVGMVLDALRALELASNTLVLFTSDNGAWYVPSPLQAGTVGVYQGTYAAQHLGYTDTGKGSTWEGGFRVPAIAWWPGTISPGSMGENATGSLDLLPTLASLANAKLPSDVVVDGQDFSPVLNASKFAAALENYNASKVFYYYRGNKLMAARSGAHKVHFVTHSGFGHEPFVYHDPPLLFNVEIDPQERDLLPHSSIVAAIVAEARQHNATLVPGAPQLDLIDYKAMDCGGLSVAESGCCTKAGGKCTTKIAF